jgi:3D (Asp-Asp-Asp) domain-containing protein
MNKSQATAITFFLFLCFIALGTIAGTQIFIATKPCQPNLTTYNSLTTLEYATCEVTAYTARKKETNHDNTNTATMEKPKPGYTCAVSRDLLQWLGGTIYIEGLGVWKVNDLMNKRFTNRIDLCVGTVKYARELGLKELNVVFLGR